MRVFKPTRKTKAGATVEYELWYVEFRDHRSQIRRVAGFTHKKQTAELGRRVLKLVACRSNNESLERELAEWLETAPARILVAMAKFDLISPRQVAAGKPLVEHIQEFQEDLIAKGTTQVHAALVANRVRKVFSGCQFTYWSQISAAGVQQYIADLRKETGDGDGYGQRAATKTKRKPIGLQTAYFYLQAVKQFCRWMVRERRASSSPVDHLQGQNVRTDRRHDRRALSIEELRRLLEAAHDGEVLFGVSGPERALIYRVAVETGLRANELRSLTKSSFQLDAQPLTVTVEAGYSKRRRVDELPLRRDTAGLLTTHLDTKLPEAQAFHFPRKEDVVRMLRADLKAARAKWIEEEKRPQQRGERERSSFLAYRDHAGCVADFHSLRHTFISNLARAGVHPKMAQSLARHSDPKLTLSRYTHTTLGEQDEAIAALPPLPMPDEVGGLRATGTEGHLQPRAVEPASSVACYVAQKGSEPGNSMHRDARLVETDEGQPDRKKGRESSHKREDSAAEKSVPRIRFERTTYGLGNRCSIP